MLDFKEKWNYIVKEYYNHYNSEENAIQKLWEEYFSEFLDYKKLYGEIDTQRRIHIGSYERAIPDIILRKENKDLAVFELKQYNLALNEKMEAQLKSYLKLLNLSVGIIICQKIYLYWYDYASDSLTKLPIDLKHDNPCGINFLKILHKDTFLLQEIRNFIEKSIQSKINIQRILTILDNNYVYNAVATSLRSEFDPKEIEEALEFLSFKIVKKDTLNPVSIPSISSPATHATIPTVNNDDHFFPNNPDFIIIKTSFERVNRCHGNLYDATRHCWRVSYERVIRYPYVLAVIDGIVREVYQVIKWQKAEKWPTDDDKALGRYEFIGNVAPDNIRSLFIDKRIPYQYRKPGMASPIVFSK